MMSTQGHRREGIKRKCERGELKVEISICIGERK